MEYKIIALHRQKSLDKGFDTDNFSEWVDIVAQWLYSIGAKSCAFGSEKDTDEIAVTATFDPEPDSDILADIVIRNGIKIAGPMRLESYDPAALVPVLTAWKHSQRCFLEERGKITKLLEGFSGQLQSVIGGRTYIPPDRISRMTEYDLKFPYSQDEVEKEREECAKLASRGFWAPTDSGGCCLECGNWTPARHPERHEHDPSCKTGKREFAGDETIATKIRLRGKS